MAHAAAIRATFSTYRLVPSRNTIQIVLEAPAEQQAEIFHALGYPIPGAETWVAVALLQNPAETSLSGRSPAVPTPPSRAASPPQQSESAIPKVKNLAKSERSREWFNGLSEEEKVVANAAMLCKDAAFQQWMGAKDEDQASVRVRTCCYIASRKELATNQTARKRFEHLVAEFQAATGRIAEARS